ncbi:MAG: choice-of-anchor B family protein [Bacteriovoracaceae bacterium]|nr:choice-of-anchor B family protein [Bacteriovoracaceae bacterium]
MNRMILLLFLVLASNAVASTQLSPLGQFKRNRNIEYNDIWGYEAPDGKEYALLGVQDGTSIVDVSDPSNLREIKFISSNRSTWKDIKTYGHYAYVVNESGGGMQILDLSKLPGDVTVAATYTGFKTSHNIFIDEGRKLLFAEGNHSEPVRIFSIENPLAPVKLSSLGVECHDIFARDGLLYVSEGGHGTIGIFNYDDPSNPTLVSRFQIRRSGYVHNAWLTQDSRYLMTTEENTGKTMKMFDLADLSNVRQVGEVLAPGKLAHNTHIKGNFAYVAHYGSGLRIYDVSNPAGMNEVAYWQKSTSSRRGFVSVWGAYPFFKSGKILISDIEDGLFVVHHESAQRD